MTTQSIIPTLIDGNLRLHTQYKADVQVCFDLVRVRVVEHVFGSPPDSVTPMTLGGANKWMNTRVKTANMCFKVVKDQLINATFRHTIKKRDQRPEPEITFDEPRLGRGYSNRAMHLILGHASKNMGLLQHKSMAAVQ